jgi:hypothetical protein
MIASMNGDSIQTQREINIKSLTQQSNSSQTENAQEILHQYDGFNVSLPKLVGVH